MTATKRLLFVLTTLVILASNIYAATGDIKSVAVLAQGCFADVTIEGLGTGGTYDFGLGANNEPSTGTPKVVFTVVSQGYTNGVLGTRTRTIYGTHWVRKPFSYDGAELTAQETVDGSDVVVRISLSESIYDSDNTTGGTGGNSGTAPTVTIASGFYTQGGTPNNATSNHAVTNNSTLAYPKVIGNWSRALNYEKVGSSIRVGAAVFHGHAQQGQQVDCVKFTAADSSGHTATATVAAATIDSTYGDPVPVIEHIADLDTSGFTQGDTGTLNFIAYPWIGNAASVMDTTSDGSVSPAGTGTASAPTPYFGPLSIVCDPAGTYCPICAVVDSSTGVDSGNVITGADTSAAAASSHPFATMFAAFNALRTHLNSAYGRNNCGGATIYLAAGNHAWTGGTIVAGTRPACALTVTRYTGTDRDNVIIASQSGGRTLGEIVRFVGIKLTATTVSGVFDTNSTTSYYHFDQCEIDSSLTPTVTRVGVWPVSRCRISNLAQGLSQYASYNSVCSLCRGNEFAATSTSLGHNKAYTVIGNSKRSAVQSTIGGTPVSPAPSQQNLVVAYNYISGSNTGFPQLQNSTAAENTHGSAVIQNVFENRGTGGQCMTFGADHCNIDCNNVVMFHNTWVGERASMAYNDQGATARSRLNWFIKCNIADDFNLKGDCWTGASATATRVFSTGTVTVTVNQSLHGLNTGDLIYITVATPVAYKTNGVAVTVVNANSFTYTFAAGSDPGPITLMLVTPHPNRIGAFPVVYGVNHVGNVWAETADIGAAGPFMPTFTGIRCLPTSTTGEPPVAPTNAIGYLKFVDRKSYNGSTNGAGNGNYRLQSDSPAIGMARDWVLPYDIDGKARRADGAAGAYEYSQSGLLLLRRRSQ